MSVYFIADSHGRVKIGVSNTPGARMYELQCAHADELHLIRTIDGGPQTEEWLHKHFSPLRIRREWFLFSDEMLTIIAPPEVLAPQKGSNRISGLKCPEGSGFGVQVLDFDKAAERIGLARRSLERLISKGEGPVVIHLGKYRRGIADTDLDDWIRSRRHAPPGEKPRASDAEQPMSETAK
jgi:predicted DNA-binding transcriptional regulator AlpA